MGPYLRRCAGDPPCVERKSDGSLVTEADREMERRIHELVVAHLAEAFFLGEESAPKGEAARRALFDRETLVVVDPIDGTSNFRQGNPHYGTLFAITERITTSQGLAAHVPRFGLAYFPAEDRAIFTREGHSVSLSFAEGIEKTLAPCPPRSSARLSLSSGMCGHRMADVDPRPYESSISEMLAVVLGTADAMFTHSKIWDIVAPWLIGANLGFGLYDLDSRRALEALTAEHFILDDEDESWRLKRPLLFTSAERSAKIFQQID